MGPLEFKDNVTQNDRTLLVSCKEKGRGNLKFSKLNKGPRLVV